MTVRQVFSILELCIVLRQVAGLWISHWTYMILPTTYFSGSVSLKQKNRHIGRIFEDSWSGRRDSNPRHPAWKAGTLPLSYSRETESILPQTLVGKQEKGKLLDNLILRSLDKSGQGVSRPTTKQILYPQNRCHKRRLTEGYLTYSLWCSRP